MKVVYVIEVDGVARYYGLGTMRRVRGHIAEAKRRARIVANGGPIGNQAKLYRAFIAALAASARVEVKVIRDGLTDTEARMLERQLIAVAPLGQLWNGNKGGGGLSSENAMEINSRVEVREKHRKNTTALWANPDYRARLVAERRARFADPEVGQKQISYINLANVSAARRRHWTSLSKAERKALIAKMHAHVLHRYPTELMREKLTNESLSKRAKTRWSNLSDEKRAWIIAKANAARLAKRKGVTP